MGRHSARFRAECGWNRLGTVTPTFAMADYHGRVKASFQSCSVSAGHEAGAATYSNALDPAMKFVSGWFGQPSAPIAIADFADPHSAPFESGTLLMASMAAEDSKLAGINLVHELVHSALPSSRPWVYEGLAHFAEAMYRQQQGGRQAALDFLGLHRAAFLDSEKEVSAALQKNAEQKDVGKKLIGQPLAATFDETYYRSKAAYVWWMLRDMVGDDALKQAIRKYRAEDDNNKDPKYVEQLIEAAAKRDLGWFFDDWVYQDRGLPDFHVQSVHPWKTEKGVQFITVTLENLGNAGAEVPFTILFEGGEITKRIEVRAKSTATTRVELPGTASEIVVNDGSVPESDLTNNVFQDCCAAEVKPEIAEVRGRIAEVKSSFAGSLLQSDLCNLQFWRTTFALHSISRRCRYRHWLEAPDQHYLRFEWQAGISGSDRLRTFPGTERMARAQLAGHPGPGA